MILALDLGGTNIKFAVFDFELDLKFQITYPTLADNGFEDLLLRIIEYSQKIISEFQIKVMGIGFPSVVLENGFVFTAPNLKDCNNINIIEELNKKIKIPIFIDNDANVAALAELELGSGKDINNFIYITLGTGVGGAIVYNQAIFKGNNCGAGEIGHLIINKDDKLERDRSYRKGILEEYLGRNQILEFSKKKYIENHHKFANLDYDVKDISEDAKDGNVISNEIIIYLAKTLAVALASVLNFLDFNCVVIGGGISQINEVFYLELKNEIQKRTLPSISHSIIIHQAKFLNDAGIYGSAILAKKLYKGK